MNQYETFIHKSRYARWLEELRRRESWPETVDRFIEFFGVKLGKDKERVRKAILNCEVMPSMRALMTAGIALAKDNVAAFNCAYITIDHQRSFDEMMYILMCGTGVGFSVERCYTNKLPEIAEEFHSADSVIKVADSKVGWAKSFRQLLAMLYQGEVPEYDVSKVRPAGSKLRTFGGRSSGPEPLISLFNYTINLFKNAKGRKLTTLECHLLCCKIAAVVVVGGVRRSALIGLSNLSDDRIRRAKHGNWWEITPELSLANNSACYTVKPDFESFMGEYHDLYKSKSGERGLFSRPACQLKAAVNGRRDADYDFGTNPCSEIILRPNQFCNLTEIVCRAEDDLETLREKATIATILGTVQATMTDFRYLRPIWRRNTEEEALLGVSMTGIADHRVLSGKVNHGVLADWLTSLRETCIEVNKKHAKRLGINQSAAITCVKPSGTVSQLVNTSSGIHARYSKYYIRTVRADMKDPLAIMMKEQGVPCEVDVMTPTNLVFSFPIESPSDSVTEGDMTGVEMLDLVALYNEHWCEHKVSATIHYKNDEFLGIGQWIWDNFDKLSGVSFLPYDDHTYEQAPYQQIDKKTYLKLKKEMVDIDWTELSKYEVSDNTTSSQELACVGNSCEL